MLCYKRDGNYVACNELPSGTVGCIVALGAVGLGTFVVRRKVPGFFWPFSKFLSSVSFFRVRVRLVTCVRTVVRCRFFKIDRT